MTGETTTSSSSSNSNAPPPPPQASTAAADQNADEIEKAPEAVQMTDEEELSAAGDKDHSDSGKLKTLVGILKRMIGVKDMAAIRLSLPANLLEPVPNLEYWNYLDRGDIFTAVGELEDPTDRMLQTLRFAFTTQLKFVHGKICKPYNSILGEHFRCHWDIEGMQTDSNGNLIPVQELRVSNASPLELLSTLNGLSPKSSRKDGGGSAASAASSRPGSVRLPSSASTATTTDSGGDSGAAPAKKKVQSLGRFMSRDKTSKAGSIKDGQSGSGSRAGSIKSPVLSATDNDDAKSISGGMENLSLGSSATRKGGVKNEKRRIVFLTEQVSHHPPISSFFVDCKETGTQLSGVDQLSAKFTGTSVKVFSGERNKGIFLTLTEDSPLGKSVAGEEYQITHPSASLNGLLRGSLWVAVCDTTYVTCRGGCRDSDSGGSKGTRLRTIVEYKDESWLMKAKYALEGVIYEYEYDSTQGDEAAEEYKTIKEVPQDKIVATIEGSWRGKITWKRKGEKESHLLINLDEIDQLPKTVRPLSSQDPLESRKIWQSVTSSIINKEFSAATRHKQRIEQTQREVAAERKRKGEDFTPQFFDPNIDDGRSRLSRGGLKAVEDERELVGYDQGQNQPEKTREAAQKNAMGSGGGDKQQPSGTSSSSRSSTTGRQGADEEAGGEEDDDDEDDGNSFRSAAEDD